MKTKLCIGCAKGFEILSSQTGTKESILDEADPSLDFATQRESVTPLAIHRLDVISYCVILNLYFDQSKWMENKS